MRMPKFLLTAFMVTSCAVFYVGQQTEIFRLAYVGSKSMVEFRDLLDENSLLRYNLKKSTSLTRVGNKILESSEFQMPDTYYLVKLSSPAESLKVANRRLTRKESLAYRLFGIKREAEAKTVDR